MDEHRVEFLRQVSTFSGVDDQGLEQLSRICTEVEKKEGDVIIKEGEEGDCAYIIEQGQVEISMAITMAANSWEIRNEAIDKVLVRLGPGSLFGEMAFIFDHDVRSATIVARSDVLLLSISSADFKVFAEEDVKNAHRIILNIAKIIAKRLRKTNEDVKKLTTVLSIALSRPRRL